MALLDSVSQDGFSVFVLETYVGSFGNEDLDQLGVAKLRSIRQNRSASPFVTLTSAPAASRASTFSLYPNAAAPSRGVEPYLVRAFTFAPFAIRSLTGSAVSASVASNREV